ncbi:AbrB/MazE/SpoVT family DNA-binding domain-containing protein [Niallia taxi]|uniref:AbrB/MazE/SpoVT family DNA-binding domain-containing protein n=1 Tax=Niallia taxi TaxID=2499688 RepID=UPI0015F3EE53|nr:AbrB/MazE/SpoVT family DNA-binding domain-containing protein [Niallia taxi]
MKSVKATLTVKGQVTIPKVVREHLQLKNGDVLLFDIKKGEESKEVFIKKEENRECCVCQGSGKMASKVPCVICEGSGVEKRGTETAVYTLSRLTNKYKKDLGLNYQITSLEDGESTKMLIRLSSDQLPQETVQALEKYFQIRIDEEMVE